MERYADPRHPMEEMVALRVLKIVEPVKDLIKDYDGYVQRPSEGVLIQRSKYTPTLSLKTSMKGAAILPHNFEDLDF
jgi:hypothetical protein